jgi:hypothetical protein
MAANKTAMVGGSPIKGKSSRGEFANLTNSFVMQNQ